jgi:hypothetical protein
MIAISRYLWLCLALAWLSSAAFAVTARSDPFGHSMAALVFFCLFVSVELVIVGLATFYSVRGVTLGKTAWLSAVLGLIGFALFALTVPAK